MGCCSSKNEFVKIYQEFNPQIYDQPEWPYESQQFIKLNLHDPSLNLLPLMNDYIRAKSRIIEKLGSLKSENGANVTFFNMRFIGPVLISDNDKNAYHQECVTAKVLYNKLLHQWIVEEEFNKNLNKIKNKIQELFNLIPEDVSQAWGSLIKEQEKKAFDIIDTAFSHSERQMAGKLCESLLIESISAISLKINEAINYLIHPLNMQIVPGLLEFVEKYQQKGFDKKNLKRDIDQFFGELTKFLNENIKIKKIESELNEESDNFNASIQTHIDERKNFCLSISNKSSSHSLRCLPTLLTTDSWKFVNEISLNIEANKGMTQNLLMLCNRIPCKCLSITYNDIKFKNRMKCWDQLPRTLKSLSIASNYFVGDAEISKWLINVQNCRGLMELSLNFSNKLGNEITNDGFELITKALGHITNLTKLAINLSGGQNSISDFGIDLLSLALLNLKNLNNFSLNLGLGENSISDVGLKYLSISIGKLVHLEEVSINFEGGKNNITDVGVKYLREEYFMNAGELKKLSLEFSHGLNCISDEGIKILVDGLSHANKLNYFWLCAVSGKNSVTQAGVQLLENMNKNRKTFVSIQVFHEQRN